MNLFFIMCLWKHFLCLSLFRHLMLLLLGDSAQSSFFHLMISIQKLFFAIFLYLSHSLWKNLSFSINPSSRLHWSNFTLWHSPLIQQCSWLEIIRVCVYITKVYVLDVQNVCWYSWTQWGHQPHMSLVSFVDVFALFSHLLCHLNEI
jgi:hypothetical protein